MSPRRGSLYGSRFFVMAPAGANASGMKVGFGGGAFIYGSSVSASLLSGAFQVVESGGRVSGTKVSAGAADFLMSGGVDSGTTMLGAVVVSSGGTASGMTVSARPSDTSTAMVSVTDNAMKNCPTTPSRSPSGKNTTTVVMVVAAISPEHAWMQPLLRMADTIVGIAVGFIGASIGLRSFRRRRAGA